VIRCLRSDSQEAADVDEGEPCPLRRSKLRYPSDVTDEEWALIGPLIPPAKRGGNKRTVDERGVVNGVLVGLPAERPATAQHREQLLPPLGLRRRARSHPPRTVCAVPGTGWTRGQPDRRHHR